jgi:RNA polymerase sigma factor (TIGR02999 family)
VNDVTHILDRVRDGDPKAADELLPLIYGELRKLAAAKMAKENPGQTLQPTALVHEAWLRLTGDQNQNWNGRAHFFGAAAEAMRRILIDSARRKQAQRHGGKLERIAVDHIELSIPEQSEDWIELDEALTKLESLDPQKAQFVKLRYFVGLSLEEAATTLGVSVPTASRWWSYARAWLAKEIESQQNR